jgi:hypothetical protein
MSARSRRDNAHNRSPYSGRCPMSSPMNQKKEQESRRSQRTTADLSKTRRPPTPDAFTSTLNWPPIVPFSQFCSKRFCTLFLSHSHPTFPSSASRLLLQIPRLARLERHQQVIEILAPVHALQVLPPEAQSRRLIGIGLRHRLVFGNFQSQYQCDLLLRRHPG